MSALRQTLSATSERVRARLPRSWGRVALLALVIALIPATVVAAEVFTGDEVIIADPVDGDLYLLGSDVLITAFVDGDVIAAGGRIQINGTVTGSVHAIAGDVIVRGDVGGSVMAAGGSVLVTGNIGHAMRAAATDVSVEGGTINGDLVVAATRLTTDEQSVVQGEVLMRVTEATLSGDALGGVSGSARNLRVSGEISGSSDVRVNSLRFMPGAAVTGPFHYTSNHEMLVDGGTSIVGPVTHASPDRRTFGETVARSLVFALFRFGWALATGWLLLKYLPQTLIGVSETLRLAPARSMLWGLLTMFGAPLAAILVAVTVIGIPIAIIMLALYLFALYASQIVVGMVVGTAVSRSRWRTMDGRPAYLRMLATGLAVVVLIRSLPLDGWYPLVSIATAMIALGAVTIYFFRPRPEEAEAPQAA